MASSTLEKNNGKNKKRPARKKAHSGRQSLNNDGIAKRGNLGRQHPGGTKTMSSPPPLREPRELHSKRQILTPPWPRPTRLSQSDVTGGWRTICTEAALKSRRLDLALVRLVVVAESERRGDGGSHTRVPSPDLPQATGNHVGPASRQCKG